MLHMTKPELVIYTLFVDQIPMSLSMKNTLRLYQISNVVNKLMRQIDSI